MPSPLIAASSYRSPLLAPTSLQRQNGGNTQSSYLAPAGNRTPEVGGDALAGIPGASAPIITDRGGQALAPGSIPGINPTPLPRNQPGVGAGTPGQGDVQSAMLQQILAALQNPGRFDANAYITNQTNELKREAALAGANVNADAARRGVFFGTPATQAMTGVQSALQRGLGDMRGQVSLAQAQTAEQDRQAAIAQALSLLGSQQGANQFNANLALQLLGMGLGGAPSQPGVQPTQISASANNGMAGLGSLAMLPYLLKGGSSAAAPATYGMGW